MFSQMRIARPVTDLDRSFRMYNEGLGLQKIAEFNDHQGFSGIMLGQDNLSWHLEFTVCLHHPVKPSQTEEDLLVLYYPDKDEWQKTCEKLSLRASSRPLPLIPIGRLKGAPMSTRTGIGLFCKIAHGPQFK